METLNVKQAADYTSLSKSSLDKLRVYGGGPLYIKVGARVVYDRVDLDTWLIGKKVANTSQREPIAFPQYPFCHGDRGAVGRSRMPIARRRRMNMPP